MKAICITTSGRVERLAACIESLRLNALEGWTLYVSMEPNCDVHTHAVIDKINFLPVVKIVNPRRLGPTLNTFSVYNAAITDGALAVLYFDDDMLLSPDAIQLCDWYLGQTWPPEVVGLGLCARFTNNYGFPNIVTPDATWEGMVGQGFCITRHNWHTFAKRVFFTHQPHWGGDDYDWAIVHSALDRGKIILRPRLSRSQHTGVVGHHIGGTVFPLEISQQIQTQFVFQKS